MAHKEGPRGLFGLASERAVAQLRDEVARLSHELTEMRANAEQADVLRGEVSRLAGELDAMRVAAEQAERHRQEETDALRRDLAALTARPLADADELAALRSRADAKETELEILRLKVAGVAEQVRWESEDLRRALTALAERVERRN